MHRFYLEPVLCCGDRIRLTGAEAHHAAVVLRVRAGEAAVVLDGQGTELRGQITNVARSAVEMTVELRHTHPPRSGLVHLAVALLKGRAWDVVLEKATELGAASIQPLAAQRCVARVGAAELAGKLAGWRSTTIAAAKQCGTPWLPVMGPPQTPQNWLAQFGGAARPPSLALIAALEAGAPSIRAVMADFNRRFLHLPMDVTVIIGPEGDFTPDEYAAFRDAGVQSITLGPLVLRADTAVIAALAVVAGELGSDSS